MFIGRYEAPFHQLRLNLEYEAFTALYVRMVIEILRLCPQRHKYTTQGLTGDPY